MCNAGWEYYTDEIAISHTIDYPRPHLIIYLDADVEETKANIKRRNRVGFNVVQPAVT